MFIFPSPQSMTGYWAWRVARIQPSPPRRPAGCEVGERALQRWTHGELACYVDQTGDPRLAKIRWTDERDNTYGILDGDDRSIKALYERWSTMTG